MQISRKAIYAIKAMIYVAAHKNKRLVTITEIAEYEGVPREYLAKILKELAQKGILISYKGVKGGYRLGKERNQISFQDILEASLESSFRSTGLSSKGKDNLFRGASLKFWQDLNVIATKKLSAMTLDKIDYKKFYPDAR